jgi:putative membrane protein
MSFKLILALMLIGFAVIFIVQNVVVVEIRFLLWTLSMSRSLLIFFLLAVGVTIGWILHSYFLLKRKKRSNFISNCF